MLLVLAACRRDVVAEGPRVVAASCALSDNPLRASCTVRLDAPGPAAIEAAGRAYESRAEQVEHQILLWGLPPSSTIPWQAGPVRGELTTGPLPAELEGATGAEGELDGMDGVFLAVKCGSMYFVVVDGSGTIVWFEPAEVHVGPMSGYTWSQADRSFVEVSGSNLLERDLAGRTVRSVDQGTLPDDLHHDVARYGPYTYVLGQDRGVDSVAVLEGSELRGARSLDEVLDLPYETHANGITVHDGQITVSLRNYDAVVGIGGDPDLPGFLELAWVATASPTSDLGVPAGVPVAAGAERLFHLQHNATADDGHLWVFDNAGDPTGARGLRMAMDLEAGTLEPDASWPLALPCTVQGGAVPLADGGALVSCSEAPLVARFGESEPSWTLDAGCEGWAMTRALPVWIE